MTTFEKVNPKQSFPKLEEEIMKFWQENKIFEESVNTRKNSPEYNFYDGPPFATWTPHYWHILAGTIKDVIPRYQTMKWFMVDRKFGWDCHGLPIENIVEKKLNISWKDDIEKKIWVFEFNEECRANVFWYVDEWKKTVNRMWRWVDMENDYKTMDTSFMESVWWVYKSLYDKWLIYEGYRVVPYCPRCSTPLSNFEVNQWYKDKQDKTATVKFKIKWTENKYFLAWTTTPWTLVSNLWLAVWSNIDYVELFDKTNNETYILAKELVKNYFRNEDDYTILAEYKWSCLEWIKYEPLFNDFWTKHEIEDMPKWMNLWENAYSVVIGHHVTTDSWTWIVHIAPAYWEDDYIIWQKHNLGFISHINDLWKTEHLLNDNEVQVFDFNEVAIKNLKEKNQIIKLSTIDHSYPHCWRCDSPLIYRAISAWYVAVEKIRDKMVVNNEKVNWTPSIIKHWRFWTWLENARDWNISRNRYWWSAIPVWQNENKTEEVCIWSIKELYELNKEFKQINEKDWKYFYTKTWKEIDLHKHFVDEILVKNPKTWNTLKRIPEVLDCWFESWAMPYASKHYPFENNENFKFPADFIAEWIDQTRGWFYTLIILWTALFDNTPFLNVIVNWTVLAEDWKKMSKSLKNYPDPHDIFNKYWADAMRFYLMNSPVVEAQDLRFAELWVEEIVKKVILPLWNTYSFFTTYANIDKFKPETKNIYFVRHGQTDRNIEPATMNPWDVDSQLNSKWIAQAKKTWKDFAITWEKIDLIITSPLSRAKDTAELIVKELWYEVEIIEDDRLKEQLAGKLKDHTHNQMRKEFWVETSKELRYIYKLKKYNWVENIDEFEERVTKSFNEIKEKYTWKNILIVGHNWTFRVINKIINNITSEETHFDLPSCPNAKILKLANYTKNNNLDKWIISELHTLIEEVTKWFDSYRLNEATRPIVKFMDNLTNWYIRRSRKRFWKSENDSDKIEAYNTLYDVLVEVCKIIAPFMPFISEHIYKKLTWRKSVHLELFPESVPGFILKNLNNDTDKVQKIITLWLSARANAKIRVRQPLSYIKIWENLSEYYLDIIKEELNVKEIKVFEESEMPKKICKPNGRLIWPKFWNNVKFIMSEAKAWNFIELENWNVKVWEFELVAWDFELVFENSENNTNQNEIFENWDGMVITINTEITESLKLEWYARDIVRQIQEARKEADYKVDDRIKVKIEWNEEIQKVLQNFSNYIQTETLSTIDNSISSWNLQKELEIENIKINLTLLK